MINHSGFYGKNLLILAGAPKCGTSSLFSWLKAHPAICASEKKELFYFMDRGNPLKNSTCNVHDHSLEEYFEHFRCEKYYQYKMEATTHYLYQDSAIGYFSNIKDCTKIFFVLRKPSERVYSSFTYTQNNLGRLNSALSFSEYVHALLNNNEDYLSSSFYSEKSKYVLLRDIDYSRYYNYLIKWERSVGRENMHILLLEEIKQNPQVVLENICNKLGIDSAYYSTFNFEKKNTTYAVKSGFLQRQVKRMNSLLGYVPFKNKLKKIYFAVQKDKVPIQSEEDLKALKKLESYFSQSNKKLETHFNLDLKLWK